MKRKVLLIPLIIFLAIAAGCCGSWRVMPKGMIRPIWNGAHWQACAEVSSRITGQSGAVLSGGCADSGQTSTA